MKKFQVLLILAMVFSLICQTVSEDAGSEEKSLKNKDPTLQFMIFH